MDKMDYIGLMDKILRKGLQNKIITVDECLEISNQVSYYMCYSLNIFVGMSFNLLKKYNLTYLVDKV